MASRESDWEGVRLHVVTGKGGTGKTTVAAALALALAGEGRRTLLVEVENRQGIAQLFDAPPLPYEERKVAVGPGGGDVLALPVDPEEALLEYLDMFYKLGRAGRGLRKIGAIDFATTIAPGMRDVLLTGKVYEAVRRKQAGRKGGMAYDAVVLDAPPTGRITRFLGVNAEVAGLAKVGPIRGQADAIMALLTSPQTAVHVVTLLEEMPVQETVDAVEELAGRRAAGRRDRGQRRPRAAVQGRRPDGCRQGPAAARRGGGGAGGRRRRRCEPAPWTRCWPRSPSTPSGSPWRRPSGAPSRRSAARRTSCRCCPRASTSVASTAWPSGSARPRRGMRMAQSALDLDTVIGDRGTRIVVCCGSGGVGKTTTAAALAAAGRRAGPRGRRADHRPGPAAGAVDGADARWTTPRGG